MRFALDVGLLEEFYSNKKRI